MVNRLMVAAAAFGFSAGPSISQGATAEGTQVARGQYLVTIGGCADCHTPGYFLGKPDAARFLGGSEVAFVIPGLGAFPGATSRRSGDGRRNLERGADRGRDPDRRAAGRRILAPAMRYHDYAHLTTEDALAIAALLKSIPPVHNRVPGPFGPGEKITTFARPVVPAEAYNGLPPAK